MNTILKSLHIVFYTPISTQPIFSTASILHFLLKAHIIYIVV